MREHVKGQHEGKTYDCKECDYKTKQKGNLNVHMMAAHESLEFTCSMCEYKTSDKRRLSYHKQSEHEGVKFSCNICEHKACIRSNLNTHMLNIHKKGNIFVTFVILNSKVIVMVVMGGIKKLVHYEDGQQYKCQVSDLELHHHLRRHTRRKHLKQK